MKSILEQLKSTEDALEYGKNATKDQVRMLKETKEECGKIVKRLMMVGDNKSLNQAVEMGMKAQLCGEALDVSKPE